MKRIALGIFILIMWIFILHTMSVETQETIRAIAAGWTFGTVAAWIATKILGVQKDEQ